MVFHTDLENLPPKASGISITIYDLIFRRENDTSEKWHVNNYRASVSGTISIAILRDHAGGEM